MGIVGEGKPFSSYRAMHACLIDDNSKLKHKKKGKAELEARMLAHKDMEEWSRIERIAFSKELVGSFNIDLAVPKSIRDRLDSIGILSIDEFDTEKEAALHWFIVEGTQLKKTKNGKEYMLVTAVGSGGKGSRIYIWGYDSAKHDIQSGHAYVAELQKSQWGFATQVFKVKSLAAKKKV
jgi:hypothetical protein